MTFNPAMMGLDPQMMQAAQEIGKHAKIEIRKCPREGRLEIKYIAVDNNDPSAQDIISNCVENFAIQIAAMHDNFFGMKGKMIHED